MAARFLDQHPKFEFIDGEKWGVTAEFDYFLGSPSGLESVRIPAGFVTDFASIPGPLRSILPPAGSAREPYGLAAVVHDWLYSHRIISIMQPSLGMPTIRLCTRAEADAVLNEAMGVLGVGRATRWAVYSGVRIEGWKPWGDYRAAESKRA